MAPSDARPALPVIKAGAASAAIQSTAPLQPMRVQRTDPLTNALRASHPQISRNPDPAPSHRQGSQPVTPGATGAIPPVQPPLHMQRQIPDPSDAAQPSSNPPASPTAFPAYLSRVVARPHVTVLTQSPVPAFGKQMPQRPNEAPAALPAVNPANAMPPTAAPVPEARMQLPLATATPSPEPAPNGPIHSTPPKPSPVPSSPVEPLANLLPSRTQTLGLPRPVLTQSMPPGPVLSMPDSGSTKTEGRPKTVIWPTVAPHPSGKGSVQGPSIQSRLVPATTPPGAGPLTGLSPFSLIKTGSITAPMGAPVAHEVPSPESVRNLGIVAIDQAPIRTIAWPGPVAPIPVTIANEPINVPAVAVPEARAVLVQPVDLAGAHSQPAMKNTRSAQSRALMPPEPRSDERPAAPPKQAPSIVDQVSPAPALPTRTALSFEGRTLPALMSTGIKDTDPPPAPPVPPVVSLVPTLLPQSPLQQPESRPIGVANFAKPAPSPARRPLEASPERRFALPTSSASPVAQQPASPAVAKPNPEPFLAQISSDFGAPFGSVTQQPARSAEAAPQPQPRPALAEYAPVPLTSPTQTPPQAAALMTEGQIMPRKLPETIAKAAAGVSRDEPVELLLDPAELGRVRFELTTAGDRVHVNLSVERAETLDLMRRNIEILRHEFREAGFGAATLAFGQWGNGKEHEAPSVPTANIPDDDLPLAHNPAQPIRTRALSDQGLDLRF